MKNSDGRLFLKSFLYAGRGIACCIRQRNMRFHLSAAVLTTAFSLAYGLTAAEYGLLFLTIGVILALEAVNTALEALTGPRLAGLPPPGGRRQGYSRRRGAFRGGCGCCRRVCPLFPLPETDRHPPADSDQLEAGGFSGAHFCRLSFHLPLPRKEMIYGLHHMI